MFLSSTEKVKCFKNVLTPLDAEDNFSSFPSSHARKKCSDDLLIQALSQNHNVSDSASCFRISSVICMKWNCLHGRHQKTPFPKCLKYGTTHLSKVPGKPSGLLDVLAFLSHVLSRISGLNLKSLSQ